VFAEIRLLSSYKFKQSLFGAPADDQVLRFMLPVDHSIFIRMHETSAHSVYALADVFDVYADGALFAQYDGCVSICVRDADVQFFLRQIRRSVRVICDGSFLASCKFLEQNAHSQPLPPASFRLHIRRNRPAIPARQQGEKFVGAFVYLPYA
jgi:hypothetical protein